MKIPLVFIASIFSLICLLPSCRTVYPTTSIEGIEYRSVISFGAKGNGSFDDRAAIQRAFDSGANILFPKGRYLLSSKSNKSAMLRITGQRYPSYIVFEKGAVLEVSPNQPNDYEKTSVIGIISEAGNNIEELTISGLIIEGNRDSHSIANTGILAYERAGSAIRKLVLENISISNVGGEGIHTQASDNHFTNIKTENCGSHGIGIINTTNPGRTNRFYLDGHLSISDEAYSIDFSGAKKNRVALEGYDWIGEAKNIVSRNSKYGIKTAGYWDLRLKNVTIEGSGNNGFFINVDAPGKRIEIDSLVVMGALANGLQLAGETSFYATNVHISGCKVGMNINKTDVEIRGLLIDGEFKNTASIRMGVSNVSLYDFTIKNTSAKDLYPVWINGAKTILQNGRFMNVSSKYDAIVKENAKDVSIDNVVFGAGKSRSTKEKRGLMNIQTKGTTRVTNSDLSRIKDNRFNDRAKKIIYGDDKKTKN